MASFDVAQEKFQLRHTKREPGRGDQWDGAQVADSDVPDTKDPFEEARCGKFCGILAPKCLQLMLLFQFINHHEDPSYLDALSCTN